MGSTSRAEERLASDAVRPSRREILDRQLARSDLHWARAVTELRESLIGMAGDLDELEQRVRSLESDAAR